jgi:hypothetical protein
MILEQYERDDNVNSLFRAMHDAFDFSRHEDTLKSIKPESEQARILTLMLQDVCTCCDFIQSYASEKDSKFCASSSISLTFVNMSPSGKRTFNNIDGGQDKKIKELSDVLVKRRTAFLNQTTISTQITAFRILDDVAKISTQLSDAGR